MSPSLCLWLLLCSLSNLTGTIVSAVEISSLNGTVGKSILLCIATDYGNETRSIEWIDKTRNQLLFKIQPGETESNWITAQDTYKGRLSVHDMRCLKIENLTSEDSGLYEVEIKLNTGEIKPQIFNVTVSGTVTTGSNMKPRNYWISIGIPVGIVCVVLLGIGVLLCKGKVCSWKFLGHLKNPGG
ncbi:SLAM family member 9-like [Monodelphis domestica]|uniref:SLAM family member 9-like n=1 Tax=Monodelphis domestica TaxID=13616 RepID=UPI0024E26793|nr:SLAM family member 9-like [Monodelphis domestica]